MLGKLYGLAIVVEYKKHRFRMNVSGFGPLNWIAGKSVTNVIQETVLQVSSVGLLPSCRMFN